MTSKHLLPIWAAVLALAACTSAPPLAVPAALQPTAGEKLVLTLPARGVQIYECRATAQGSYEWAFVAPEATLFDASGNRAGTHGAGPHWLANDGSRIVGTLKQRADAPAAGAVPWLLLAARNDGPAGTFSSVTSIQRVRTAGGVAPASGCAAASVGQKARVDYTADYRFFAPA